LIIVFCCRVARLRVARTFEELREDDDQNEIEIVESHDVGVVIINTEQGVENSLSTAMMHRPARARSLDHIEERIHSGKKYWSKLSNIFRAVRQFNFTPVKAIRTTVRRFPILS
jgi:hypothetical protein